MRNFSFSNSKRLPEEKMTVISDISIPAISGTCFHAILCALLENKNKFITWEKLLRLVEKYLVMFGGDEAWKKFAYHRNTKIENDVIMKKIKTNIHTLTRTGKNCYGFRLHSRGIAIYYFRDGAMIRVGGKYIPAKGRRSYSVAFKDGTQLQVRNKGRTLSYREYKDIIGNIFEEEDGL